MWQGPTFFKWRRKHKGNVPEVSILPHYTYTVALDY